MPSSSILVDMADIALIAASDALLDTSESDVVVESGNQSQASAGQQTNRARSDVFTTSATSRAVRSAPRPSLDESTSSSLAAWTQKPREREPLQRDKDGNFSHHEGDAPFMLPSLHEGQGDEDEDEASVAPAPAGTNSSHSHLCLPGMLSCLSASKHSDKGFDWRNTRDLEANLPSSSDGGIDPLSDDRTLPSFFDHELLIVLNSLIVAVSAFALDILLVAMLWSSSIIAGASVATFLVALPIFLNVIAVAVAIRNGWRQEIIHKQMHRLIPISPIMLDVATIAFLPYLHLSSMNLSKPCKSRTWLLQLEATLRDHWSCRTILVLCFQAVPMLVLKCILLGIYATSTTTQMQGVLGASLISSLAFIACFYVFEVVPSPSTKMTMSNLNHPDHDGTTLMKRVWLHLVMRLSYKGGHGEGLLVKAGAVAVVIVAPGIPSPLNDRVAAFRPNAQINLDDLELPGLHRLQKVKLMELSVADRPRLVIANSIVASTSCASAASATQKLLKGCVNPSNTNLGTLSKASNYPLKKARQTLLAIPTLSALQRLTSFCLPAALSPFVLNSPLIAEEREILLSLVSFEDAALQESWPDMDYLLASVLCVITSKSNPAPTLFGPSCLTTLMIKGTRLSPNGIELLSEALSDDTCTAKLSTLILSEAGLIPAAFSSVCVAISKNKGLRFLDLSCSKPGPSGAQALGQMLSSNQGLIEVNLSYMGLDSSSGGAVLSGAGRSTTLIKLDLSQNHIRDDAPLLEHLIPQDPVQFKADSSYGHGSDPQDLGPYSLKHLDLSFNWIEDGAAAWLLIILQLAPSLKHVNISHNSYAATQHHSNQTPPSLSRQPSTQTPRQHGAASGSPHQQNHSGQLQACTLKLEEGEARDRGLTFIAHLLSYRSLRGGDDETLLSRLDHLESLDIRGMILPSWFCHQGSELRPSCLIATVPKNQPPPGQLPSFKGSWLAAAAMEKRSNLRKNSASLSRAGSMNSSMPDSGEENVSASPSQAGGSQAGSLFSLRRDKSDSLSSLFSLPPMMGEASSASQRPPSRQRTIERIGSQGAWQEANTVPEEDEEGDRGDEGKVPPMKLLAAIMESESGLQSSSNNQSDPRNLTGQESRFESGPMDNVIPHHPLSRQRTLDMSLLPPEIQLPRRWIRRLQEPGASLDMNEKDWRKLSKGQQACGLYLFFECQNRILVTNVCKKAREAMLRQLFISTQVTMTVSDYCGGLPSQPPQTIFDPTSSSGFSKIGFVFKASNGFDASLGHMISPATNDSDSNVQYSDTNVVDFEFASRHAKSTGKAPIVYGRQTPSRVSESGDSVHSTTFESATSNAISAAQSLRQGNSPIARPDQSHPHSVTPIFQPPTPPTATTPTSPSPSLPLSSYRLSISSRKRQSLKLSNYLFTPGFAGPNAANEAGSAPTSGQSLNLPQPASLSPCASLLATGVTDWVVGKAPGQSLGLLYGPSSNNEHFRSREASSRACSRVASLFSGSPMTRMGSVKNEAQAVLMIGSAESRPILRILPRLLEMPLLARLQSRERDDTPLVMELLLRGLDDRQAKTFEWLVAVIRLFAAKHQCPPLLEEVV